MFIHYFYKTVLYKYLYLYNAVNHEESQNHFKSTQSHYLKIHAKLPLHIKVALSKFHIYTAREHTYMTIYFQTHSMLCKQNN